MAIEDIVRRIMTDAEAERQEVLSQADAEAQRITERHRQEADVLMEDLRSRAEKERATMEGMIVSTARSGASRDLLEAKESLINDVISSALDSIRSLSDDDYSALLKRLYLHGSELTGSHNRAIPCTDRDAQALARAGIEATRPADRSAVSGTTAGGAATGRTGGVIIESADGQVRVDNSFEALVDRKRLALKVMLSDMLFPEDG